MDTSQLSRLPSVDRLLSSTEGRSLTEHYGHQQTTGALRDAIQEARIRVIAGAELPSEEEILAGAGDILENASTPALRPVINLTGTILHTNLGRASLPASAVERIAEVAASPSNLEFDLDTGERGDRDAHIETLICEITGAEAATVVNNNAAAVMLTLNTLALGKEVPVSRGELVEIGGSFRIPEIMSRAGCTLVEVGATNRTHVDDYAKAIGPATAMLMKVHTSNYQIQGFTRVVEESELAELAGQHSLPMVTDLGSGTLIDLTRFNLPYEPTAQSALKNGADLITFSGDKLLGGPQAGIIVGRSSLVERLKSNPMKRALRVDKMTMAALYEVLSLYRDPDRLTEALPTLQQLTRKPEEIRAIADKLLPILRARFQGIADVSVEPCMSQIGSGSLPTDLLPGFALAIQSTDASDATLRNITRAFRELPIPVIGRIHAGRLLFDLRTLVNPDPFINQLAALKT
jgi:L-seryl-tRNA(Ser) seleniumtransferase